MKVTSTVQFTLLSCFAVALITSSGSLVGNAQQGRDISWWAKLFPNNSDYIQVTVDATNLHTNERVSEAHFDVAFYDARNRLIKKEGFRFLDQKLSFFEQQKYTRFFKHSCPTAKRAEGVNFKAFASPRGGGGTIVVGPILLFEVKQSTETSESVEGLIDALPETVPGLEVLVHLQDIGDRAFGANEFAGTRGESRQLQGFQIRIVPHVEGLSLRYFARVHDKEDVIAKEGEYAGTRGQARQLEEFAVELSGPAAAKYDVIYMAHIQDIGDTRFFKNGEFCGSRGQGKRIEGILVRIVPK